MYKNQLQQLAQKSFLNLPSYTCIREGPDHTPRFKAVVNFNGENFECPDYCTTLKLAEHLAAKIALNSFTSRGPTNSLSAKILDQTGLCKNLLQEVSNRVTARFPTYTSSVSGPAHSPVFSCIVELAGITFTGEPAKTKKQAEKNAAVEAWSALKKLTQQTESSSLEKVNNDDKKEHVIVALALQKFLTKARNSNLQFPISFSAPKPRPTITEPPPATSRILPLISPETVAPGTRPLSPSENKISTSTIKGKSTSTKIQHTSTHLLFAERVKPHTPIKHKPHCGMELPITIRNAIPVFSTPPYPPPTRAPSQVMWPQRPSPLAHPVCVRQVLPGYSAPPQMRPKDVSAFNVCIGSSTTMSSNSPMTRKEDAAKQVVPGYSGPLQIQPKDVSASNVCTGPSNTVSSNSAMTKKAEAGSDVKGELSKSLMMEDLKEI